jgi:hypothetical protein
MEKRYRNSDICWWHGCSQLACKLLPIGNPEGAHEIGQRGENRGKGEWQTENLLPKTGTYTYAVNHRE